MKPFKLIFVCILLFVSVLSGKILKVPQDYSTIQSAVSASQNLDTVLVSEGTYYENIKYNGKNIVLASNYIFTKDFKTIQNTIINGSKAADPDSGSCVIFNRQENSNAVLEGFTLTGGTGTIYKFTFGDYQEGGAIQLNRSSAIIRNNIIIDNNIVAVKAARGGGGGIASMYGNPLIYNNLIVSNDAGYAGGIVLNWSSGKIFNNIIYHNIGGASFGTGGIMIWEPTSDVDVENNTIIGNISLKDAGGVNINSTISVVKNNIIWGNRQVSGLQVINPNRGSFNDIEDYSDANNISANPLFLENSFLLSDNSPCIDAGDPLEKYNDFADPQNTGKALLPSKGTLINDIGAFGGSLAALLPDLNVSDLYISKNKITNLRCEVTKEAYSKVEILNLSSSKLVIDSVTHNNTNYVINYPQKSLNVLQSDTLNIKFKPTITGTISDTIKIYHQAKGAVNPLVITVKGQAIPLTDVETNKRTGYKFELYQNYPNPFNPSTNIEFRIANFGFVTLKIYNILGKEVDNLINNELKAGQYSIEWKPKQALSSGIYFSKLTAGGYMSVKKMIYQK